nr:zinc finger, LIM-type [Tanacetum cinerariifolium]
ENNYSSFDGNLYCKPHFEQKVKKNKRLPRGLSLPKPSELRKTSSIISSIFFKTQAKLAASKLPPSGKRDVPRTISEAKGDDEFVSYPLTTTNQMNLKEAAQKIKDEYPSIDIFSSVVESAALLHDHVYDIYGLADLCSEEELAEEFMEMLKSDVCQRLGKRYNRCTSNC